MIRIVVADDHALFRQGVCSLLRLYEDFCIVAEVDRADAISQVIDRHSCDLLLLDLEMERNSLADVAKLAERVAVLVVTASERPEDALLAVRSGARGLVLKRFAVETLAEAIRMVGEGGAWFPPSFQALLASELRQSRGAMLTRREVEVIRCVARGMRNAEVARTLFISEVTVKTHLNNVFHKLGIRDRVGLTLYAVRTGLVSSRDELP